MGKLTEIEPEIAAILAAARLRPTKVTFINHTLPYVFTIDLWKGGIRLIYSKGFLDVVRGMAPHA